MSLVEPGQDRTIGPEPVGPAPEATVPNPPPEVVETEPDSFPRSYVEELRQENAKWRTQLREYESEFDGVDPEERRALAEFARLSHAAENGDAEASRMLEELLGQDAEPTPTGEVPPAWTEDDFRRIAREEADRAAGERVREVQVQDSVNQIVSQARTLGYDQGSEDYILLMRAANALNPDEHADLLVEADRQVKAYKQQIVESYLAAKEADTNGSLRVPVGSGTPPAEPRTAKSWEEARQFLHDRIARGG